MEATGGRQGAVVDRSIVCPCCRKVYAVSDCGAIAADEAERLGL